jgi:hypothetical protein
MRKINTTKLASVLLTPLFVVFSCGLLSAQDKVEKEVVVKLKYYNDSNAVNYVILQAKVKVGDKTEPLPNQSFKMYLDSNSDSTLLGESKTDMYGKAKYVLPVSLQSAWSASPTHSFIAVNDKGEEVTDISMAKSKIEIDTANVDGVRSITAKVYKFENNTWVGASDVELKIGVLRLGGGILSAGDDPTYTTDSSGTATVEFKRDSLPGDENGHYFIVAKAEDSDPYGTIIISKNVPWGKAFVPSNDFFNKRALWTTRMRTPYWLLFMAYSIVIGVWGTLIYLIVQFFKLRKMGKV